MKRLLTLAAILATLGLPPAIAWEREAFEALKQITREQAERERAAKEQAEQEQAEQERAEQERAEQERAAREQAAKEQAAREQAEQAKPGDWRQHPHNGGRVIVHQTLADYESGATYELTANDLDERESVQAAIDWPPGIETPPHKSFGNQLIAGDSLYILKALNSASGGMICHAPPFNSQRFYSAPSSQRDGGILQAHERKHR